MLELQNIYMGYPNRPLLLQNLSYRFDPGTFTLLQGKMGSGKSLLVKLLNLDLPPKDGRILFNGELISFKDHEKRALCKQQIGPILKSLYLLEDMTLYENIILPLKISDNPQRLSLNDAVEMIEWIGLEHHIHSYPSELSQGEKLKALVARALVFRPKVILMDEIISVVDADFEAKLFMLLENLRSLGTTIILCAPNNYTEKWAHKFNYAILELSQGKLFKLQNAAPQFVAKAVG